MCNIRSYFVCAPGSKSLLSQRVYMFINMFVVLLTTLWVIKVEKEHAAHEAHIKEEHGGELPEIPRYPYLNMRSAYIR
jgi:cytochrome c oxidase subunit 6a